MEALEAWHFHIAGESRRRISVALQNAIAQPIETNYP
jgi:hypothetical protein